MLKQNFRFFFLCCAQREKFLALKIHQLAFISLFYSELGSVLKTIFNWQSRGNKFLNKLGSDRRKVGSFLQEYVNVPVLMTSEYFVLNIHHTPSVILRK